MAASLETVREGIVGSWTLVSYITKPDDADEPINYPLGKDAQGFLHYTPQGFVSAQLMAVGSKPYTSQDVFHVPDDEAADAARHYLSYSGPYEVIMLEGETFLKHHVEVALVPNWVGKPQLRRCQFRGDEMTLSPQHPNNVNV